jgi:hypothetical protein
MFKQKQLLNQEIVPTQDQAQIQGIESTLIKAIRQLIMDQKIQILLLSHPGQEIADNLHRQIVKDQEINLAIFASLENMNLQSDSKFD